MSDLSSMPFYEETMQFVEQFRNAKDDNEQDVVIKAWTVWKTVNNIGQYDWACLRFVTEVQAVMISVQEQTVREYDTMVNTYRNIIAQQTDRVEKMTMYSQFLEERFLGRPGPSDYPAS